VIIRCFYCAEVVGMDRVNVGGMPLCACCEERLMRANVLLEDLPWIEVNGPHRYRCNEAMP